MSLLLAGKVLIEKITKYWKKIETIDGLQSFRSEAKNIIFQIVEDFCNIFQCGFTAGPKSHDCKNEEIEKNKQFYSRLERILFKFGDIADQDRVDGETEEIYFKKMVFQIRENFDF